MNKIVHISTVHPASDHRLLDKECRTLAGAGFDVFLIARSERDFRKFGVKVLAFKTYQSRLIRATIGVLKIVIMALKLDPKVVHVHDPELLWTSWIFRLKGIPFIYDSHEHVPKQITSKPWLKPSWLRNLIAKSASAYEHFFSLFADKIISVTPEIVARFPKRKGVLIRNFPPIDSDRPGIEHSHKAKITVIYAGGLTKIRGIKEIVEAFSGLPSNYELKLLGPWENESFRSECLAQVGPNITYLGLVPPAEVAEYIRQADIGLAILYPVENYLMSYPVKAFEYMKEGLPIIMSDFSYWQNLYASCAVFVNPHDVSQIKEAIKTLGESPEMRSIYGARGYQLVREQYNWELEGQKLKETYLSLFN